MTVIVLGALGLAMRATTSAAEPDTAAMAQVSREDIEWLDVWLPHSNDHRLPRVLLIGDSITRGYYPDVEKALAGRAYVARLSTSKSLGDAALLKEITLILSEERYQVIHFNNGLHGSGYSEAAYAQALPSVMAAFRRHAPGIRASPRISHARWRAFRAGGLCGAGREGLIRHQSSAGSGLGRWPSDSP
jgi:hypothetical protein